MGHKRQRPVHLASKLLAIRKHLQLSQSQIIAIVDAGISTARISEWEHGVREPDLIVLLRYARAAGVGMETLVDDDLKLPRGFKGKAVSNR